MENKNKLGDIYKDLIQLKDKLFFLNDTTVAHLEKVESGAIDIHSDMISGQYLIYSDLEEQLKNILNRLEKAI